MLAVSSSELMYALIGLKEFEKNTTIIGCMGWSNGYDEILAFVGRRLG